MTRTTWTLHTDTTLRQVSLTVETSDPEILRQVEEAASRHGVELLRELNAGDESLRARIRDAIRYGTAAEKLPGLEATVDRVMAELEREPGEP